MVKVPIRASLVESPGASLGVAGVQPQRGKGGAVGPWGRGAAAWQGWGRGAWGRGAAAWPSRAGLR